MSWRVKIKAKKAKPWIPAKLNDEPPSPRAQTFLKPTLPGRGSAVERFMK